MFDEIAYELSNGKKVQVIHVFEALVPHKAAIKKLVAESLKK